MKLKNFFIVGLLVLSAQAFAVEVKINFQDTGDIENFETGKIDTWGDLLEKLKATFGAKHPDLGRLKFQERYQNPKNAWELEDADKGAVIYFERPLFVNIVPVGFAAGPQKLEIVDHLNTWGDFHEKYLKDLGGFGDIEILHLGRSKKQDEVWALTHHQSGTQIIVKKKPVVKVIAIPSADDFLQNAHDFTVQAETYFKQAKTFNAFARIRLAMDARDFRGAKHLFDTLLDAGERSLEIAVEMLKQIDQNL